MSPVYDYEQGNFVNDLFNDSVRHKEILNMGESTEFKDDGLLPDDFNSPDCPSALFKDLLDVHLTKIRKRSPTASFPAIPSWSMEINPFFY